MSESIFSASWYRVAALKPVLRETVILSRHVYRGQPWYVLTNRLTGASHRFNAAAYAFIGQMDGIRTVQDIWDNIAQLPDADLPTQDACIRLLARLHDADLMQSDILPSTLSMIHAEQQQRDQGWKRRLGNPFFLRLPLWNPDRFLTRWQGRVAPLFTWTALLVWGAIVLAAGVQAGLHWTDLTNSWSDRLLNPRGLLLLWLTYPLLKILHEFGHAFAVKHWGGEVHEMGITLLAFTPVPYVDASASAAFADKRHRIGVAAMGMMVELLLAALALFVWLNVESGLVSAIAYNIVFIGGVSTLVFNGNPLLRYDGYYILSDLIEIPNLWQRSNRYLGYLLKRYLLDDATAESPVTAPGERAWFLLYGPLAFCYRLLVLVLLVWLVSHRFFVIGLAIALWGVIAMLIVPTVRMLAHLLRDTGKYSRRARLTVGSLILGLSVLLFVIPVPLWTSTQGVVWLPEQSVLRAGTDCEIIELLAAPDRIVAKDTPLIRGDAPFLATQIEIQRARLDELQASYTAQPLHQRVERKIILDTIKQVQGDLCQAEEEYKKRIIRSPVQGRFVLLDGRNLPGHFAKQGEVLGYVLAEGAPTVRVVVGQADIGLVRERLSGARVLLAEHPSLPIRARVERIVPGADFTLPSAALGTNGGGTIPVDPLDANGLRALKAIFQLDLRLPADVQAPHIGGRVYVRLEHGTMPLALQWFRDLRQLLLRKFYD